VRSRRNNCTAGRDFYKNVGEIDYDAPDCEQGGGARYMLADPNAIMRTGVVLEGNLGFAEPTLVYPNDPVEAVVIKSRFLMSSNGTTVCSNVGAGTPMIVGQLAAVTVSFTPPFRLTY
jgi:hypothetical protein